MGKTPRLACLAAFACLACSGASFAQSPVPLSLEEQQQNILVLPQPTAPSPEAVDSQPLTRSGTAETPLPDSVDPVIPAATDAAPDLLLDSPADAPETPAPQEDAVEPEPVRTFEPKPVVKLRALDKITARTMTFDAKVGSTTRFGDIYIKVQTCKSPPPIFRPESAAFVQVWEVPAGQEEAEWVFSGWMFASSPALSAMDNAVYDVWVLECIDPSAPVEKAVPDENAAATPAATDPAAMEEAPLD